MVSPGYAMSRGKVTAAGSDFRVRDRRSAVGAEARDEAREALRLRRTGRRSDQAAAHHRDQVRLRHRLGIEVALSHVAAEGLQLVAFMYRFDAFSYDLEIESF